MADVPSYYTHQRREEMLPYVPAAASSVLDVGCAAGEFGRALLEERPGLVIDGIELDERAAAEARKTYRTVVAGPVPDALPRETYDAVVCNDVLEHLVDPWAAVAALRANLAPGGTLLASIPNMRYWDALGPLLRGRWDYAEHGVLDRTHLRWFTKATMVELFEGAGYEVVDVRRLTGRAMDRRWKLLSLVAPRFVTDVLTKQYVLLAR